MKATSLGLIALCALGACAVANDPSPGTCNAKSVDCGVAGSGVGGGGAGAPQSSAGASTAGANASGGTPSSAGADPGGAGAPGAGGSPASAGAPAAGAPAGGAPAGGAPAGGAPAGGAPAAGAPAAGAPAAGAPAGGSGGAATTGNLVIIKTNRDKAGFRYYLKLGAGNYLNWTATLATDAEVFEQVSAGTDKVKLRATSINKFVTLDQNVPAGETKENDYLVANGTEATAAVINIALCVATNAAKAPCAPNCRGMQVMADDDVDNFVASDDQFTQAAGSRARSNTCGTGSTDWESWELIAK